MIYGDARAARITQREAVTLNERCTLIADAKPRPFPLTAAIRCTSSANPQAQSCAKPDPFLFGAALCSRPLERRIRAITEELPPGAPLRVVLNTRKKPALEPGIALSIDWTHRFDGRTIKSPGLWQQFLLPALETIAQVCEEHAPGRLILAEGLCALPAAVALGTTFLATRRLPLAWRQISPNRPPELWSLDCAPEPSGFSANIIHNNPAGDDLALLVSVASNVEPAFAATRPKLHQLRGLVIVTKPGNYPHDLETGGQARDLVRVIVEELRHGRRHRSARAHKSGLTPTNLGGL
jgi:hypothetical protein